MLSYQLLYKSQQLSDSYSQTIIKVPVILFFLLPLEWPTNWQTGLASAGSGCVLCREHQSEASRTGPNVKAG